MNIDRAKISRYGPERRRRVQEVVEVAVGGKEAGQVFEGDRRFDLLVRSAQTAARETWRR